MPAYFMSTVSIAWRKIRGDMALTRIQVPKEAKRGELVFEWVDVAGERGAERAMLTVAA